MNYTITLNPSLDYYMDIPSPILRDTNRSVCEHYIAAGKGVNASYMLKNLGTDSVCLGFTGGFTGKELVRRIESAGIKSDFTEVENMQTRINIKLPDGTELNAAGVKPEKCDIDALLQKLALLTEGDTVFFCGKSDGDGAEAVFRAIHSSGARFILDTSGDALLRGLKYRPFLIKPNESELRALFTDGSISENAEKLRAEGAENVLVSLGEKGAELHAKDGKVYTSTAHKGCLVSAVGAGDSMTAGFVWAYDKTRSFATALEFSVAAGSATAFSDGIATADDIFKLFDKKKLNLDI